MQMTQGGQPFMGALRLALVVLTGVALVICAMYAVAYAGILGVATSSGGARQILSSNKIDPVDYAQKVSTPGSSHEEEEKATSAKRRDS